MVQKDDPTQGEDGSRGADRSDGDATSGGDLQSDEAWADAGAGNEASGADASDEGPSFEDPHDR